MQRRNNRPPVVGDPKINVDYSILAGDKTSADAQVKITWTTENTKKATMDNKSIRLPSGDTTISIKKGETKNILFVVENTNGIKIQKSLYFPVPAAPTLSVKATPASLPPGGGDVHLTWMSTGSEYGVFYNGVSYFDGTTGITLNIPASGMDSITFIAKGKGGETTIKLFVPVGQIPTKKDTLSNFGSWGLVKLRFQDEPGLDFREDRVDDCLTDNRISFSQNPDSLTCDRGEVKCFINEARVASAPYTLIGNVLKVGTSYTIMSLNQDTLVWRFSGGVSTTEETYIHK